MDQASILPTAPTRGTVDCFALESPKTLSVTATVHEVRDAFRDDHVHMVLLVSERYLLGCIERADIVAVPDAAQAAAVATLRGRTVLVGDGIDRAWAILARTGSRRLAVIDAHNELVGLLCLKRSRAGFCSAADAASRAEERDHART